MESSGADHSNGGGSGHSSSETQKEDVNTVYVAGLPVDVKPRELFLFFKGQPGYMRTVIRTYTENAIAFCTFDTHEHAVEAIKNCNDTLFDPETSLSVKLRLAKTSSKRNRHGGYEYAENQHTEYNPAYASGRPKHFREFKCMHKSVNRPMHGSYPNPYSWNPTVVTYRGQNPCATLFVSEISETLRIEDLASILSQYQGYMQLNPLQGQNVAFAKFSSTDYATAAMRALQDGYCRQERPPFKIGFARHDTLGSGK